jgi:hypothetical protein
MRIGTAEKCPGISSTAACCAFVAIASREFPATAVLMYAVQGSFDFASRFASESSHSAQDDKALGIAGASSRAFFALGWGFSDRRAGPDLRR